jgi:hypothetical protein
MVEADDHTPKRSKAERDAEHDAKMKKMIAGMTKQAEKRKKGEEHAKTPAENPPQSPAEPTKKTPKKQAAAGVEDEDPVEDALEAISFLKAKIKQRIETMQHARNQMMVCKQGLLHAIEERGKRDGRDVESEIQEWENKHMHWKEEFLSAEKQMHKYKAKMDSAQRFLDSVAKQGGKQKTDAAIVQCQRCGGIA